MMNVILIGYRCSGKTSVGKRLALELGREFVDTDDRLVAKAKRSISSIVEDEGWESFRQLEREVVREVCARDNTVIATGGGVVLNPANVAAMQRSGRVVWLQVSPQVVKQRMAGDTHTEDMRPSLTSKGLYAEILDVMKERATLYEKSMDISVDTDGKGIDEIADIIIKNVFAGNHLENGNRISIES